MTVSTLLASKSLLGSDWESRYTIIACLQGKRSCYMFPSGFWALAEVSPEWKQDIMDAATQIQTMKNSYYGFRADNRRYFHIWDTRDLSDLATILGIKQEKLPIYVASLMYKAGRTPKKYDYSYYTNKAEIRNAIIACSACHRVALRLMACGACREARYCNVECQRADRARHRNHCQLRVRHDVKVPPFPVNTQEKQP